jgi:pSer/pThr/pTyr-binding forkhead associated (FHA) protein
VTGSGRRLPTLWIVLPSGERVPHRLARGSTLVGRDLDVRVRIPSEEVSRHHAELAWDGGEHLFVRDLDSRNGTRVNGRPVVGWVEVHDGDVVRFAGADAVVETGGEASGPTLVAPTVPPSPSFTPRRFPDIAGETPPYPVPPHVVAAGPASRGGSRPSQVPVFVSHSSEDKRVARMVAQYLRRGGWKVWIDEVGIAGGKQWHSELIRALESTWVVLLLVTYHSMRSRWVVREIQAADRLGLTVIPVVFEDAPYPDELRMILAGVQRVEITPTDSDRLRAQLARLDETLVLAARQGRPTRPGRVLTTLGTTIRTVGIIGALAGFVLFVYLGYLEVSAPQGPGGGVPRPFFGWGVFALFVVVTGIGEGIRRAGLRKGI